MGNTMFDAYTGEALDDYDLHELFDSMLDELYGTVEVVGLTFDVVTVFKELDPIAYRCSYIDWLSSELEDGGRFTEEAPVEEDEED